MKTTFASNWRIILTITGKDLLDGFKNKHVLAVILPAIFVVILYRFIPVLKADDGPTRLRVLDGGNPAVVEMLADSPDFYLSTYIELESMQYALTNEEQPEIALVLPNGFDDAVKGGETPVLQGYMLSYFTETDVSTAEQKLENDLGALLETPVDIRIEQIPLLETSYGITVLNSLGLTFVILMVGFVALPQLILEEKHEKTLDFLLVSPANNRQIVIAKTLTGLAITMTVFLMALAVFRIYFVQWWLILLTGLAGATYAVAFGLALGMIIDSRQQLTLWGWVVLTPHFLPMIIILLEDIIPASWVNILQWVPSVALMRLVRTSMAEEITAPFYAPQLAVLAGAALLVLLLDIWLLRRTDQ